ncbi:hypothetical protein BCR33DRAFT_722141 [Rhizoclosmatium globosum]|uniref:Uncharacterized protein n=1 Tax=Rhizoclosmatium globosum TaxID=329046 RepID=A0A1Y2BNL5_9FUNG|nr:hypothetical protein BCR33DRAFT_722141 [Rhizoclosmatium globosum]|eukprot:ORY36336.1 hypothetical protein BCR33DRAFT_722141 [Rhizoclosmatium globosum]
MNQENYLTKALLLEILAPFHVPPEISLMIFFNLFNQCPECGDALNIPCQHDSSHPLSCGGDVCGITRCSSCTRTLCCYCAVWACEDCGALFEYDCEDPHFISSENRVWNHEVGQWIIQPYRASGDLCQNCCDEYAEEEEADVASSISL